MTARRELRLKIGASVLAAFAVSMLVSALLHGYIAGRDAEKMIDHAFEDVTATIVSRANARLVRQAMAAREHLEDGWGTDREALVRLARELQVTDVSVADARGVITHSSDPDYVGFDFVKAGGQAARMACLLRNETEYCQPFRVNAANGKARKYVGVWRPEGGFVEIGCDEASLRNLVRTSLVDLTANWRVAGTGGIVITTDGGLVISDLAEKGRDGAHWTEPDDSFYWRRRDIYGFPVYVMIPKAAAAVERNVLVGTTALLNGAALVFVALLVGVVISAFVRAELRRQAAKDMAMATEIQLAALPRTFPPFPDETRMDVYASMETAREVGGDFYDFCFTGPDRLFFLVADVSGKGVPAALFMMRAKTLLKGAAQAGRPLAEVFREANDALCEGNASNTFVTAWGGEIDLATGAVTYVNAGHNPPVVCRNGAAEFLRGRRGLVLGAMPGFPYAASEFRLAPGESLYLYTDGLTEQSDASGAFFGEDRLLACLQSVPTDLREMLDRALRRVRDFAGGAEQADDCTQLVLRYRGADGTASRWTARS